MQQGWKKSGQMLAALLLVLVSVGAQAANKIERICVLVVAPDRGFLGNEEVRDAFAIFADKRKAALLFVTDERSEAVLDARLHELHQQGAKQLVVLPLVLSTADARWQLAASWLAARRAQGASIRIAPVYGESYLAAEDLSQRLASVTTDQQRLLLVGYGVANAKAAEKMRADLLRLGRFGSDLPADKIDAVVYPLRQAQDREALQAQFDAAIKDAGDALVVPLALASRHDSMMVFARWFARELPQQAQLLDAPLASSAALCQWMQLAFNQLALKLVPPTPAQVGVVVLAHGADWFWNQAIRDALAPLEQRHPVSYAFTMADQPVMARAVQQLQQQPKVRAIIVVRAFGMASSFRGTIERMLGLDVKQGDVPAHGHQGHGMDMGMSGHHMTAGASTLAAAARIRSALPLSSIGGVEDNPLFAQALLANARAVSHDPQQETLILVAHGAGADQDNAHWLQLLASLGKQMQALPGYQFQAMRQTTWREDWPDKNRAAVKQVRAWVQEISAAGGRAVIVPARINGQGAADRYLKGLDFGWSQGFVQTPYFADWFEAQVAQAVAHLSDESAP